MRKRLLLLLGVVALLVVGANVSVAYQLQPRDLAERVARAVATVRVKVVEGAEIRIAETDGTPVSCGFDYRARVLEVLGEGMSVGEVVRFRSMDELRLGRDYLVLFGSNYLDAALSFTAMGRDRPDLLERCQETAPKLFASAFHGEVFEFDEFGEVETGSEWIKVVSDATTMPQNAETRPVSLSGAEAPIYRLFKWADVRAALLKAVAGGGDADGASGSAEVATGPVE